MASLMPEQDLLGRALTTDDPVQLLTQVKKALLNEPDDPIALAAQGVVLQKSGDPSSRADALSALLKAAHEASDDFVIWPRVAHAVHSIGKRF
jgi:predicted Zn-dependent protease